VLKLLAGSRDLSLAAAATIPGWDLDPEVPDLAEEGTGMDAELFRRIERDGGARLKPGTSGERSHPKHCLPAALYQPGGAKLKQY